MKENEGYLIDGNISGCTFENCSFSYTFQITIADGKLIDDRELQHLRMLGFDVVARVDPQQEKP